MFPLRHGWKANQGFAFQGPQPVGAGFVLAEEEARALLREGGDRYQEVVRPYLIGNDILRTSGQQPSRYIIDFGLKSLEEAKEYPLALRIVEERVKPEREKNRREARRRKWWLLGELVPAMRAALAPLSRYVATSAVAKRFMFVWCESDWCPSNRTIVFALEEEVHIGVLNSSIHTNWALAQGGTFEDRPHYTHTTTFETFPWPAPSSADLATIKERSETLTSLRRQLCREHEIGLTELYNQVDEGAFAAVAEAQSELDHAVAAGYSWPSSIADDAEESNRRLLELNKAIVAGEVEYNGPGVAT
jgi:restriction-modification enzyme MmeI-like protein